MNHSLPGVNAGYVTRDRLLRNHLRQQQERISAIALEKAGKKADSSCRHWLMSTNVDTTATTVEESKQAA
jgi:hypothetical protein